MDERRHPGFSRTLFTPEQDRAAPMPGIAGLFQSLAHALGHGEDAAVQIPGHMRPVAPPLGKPLLPGHVILQIRGLRRDHPSNDLKETAMPFQHLARRFRRVHAQHADDLARLLAARLPAHLRGQHRHAEEGQRGKLLIGTHKKFAQENGMPLEAFDNDGLARDEDLTGNAHAGLIHDFTVPGRAVGHAQTQCPCFRVEDDEVRAQKTMPLGEEREQ